MRATRAMYMGSIMVRLNLLFVIFMFDAMQSIAALEEQAVRVNFELVLESREGTHQFRSAATQAFGKPMSLSLGDSVVCLVFRGIDSDQFLTEISYSLTKVNGTCGENSQNAQFKSQYRSINEHEWKLEGATVSLTMFVSKVN